jgi:putative Mg2+ transporter-C (MgtC) family protein
MHTEITWWEVAVRLLLSFAAGAVLGANRTEYGRAAGLRTTVLVCLTAAVSFILANLLLQTTGKTPDSFVSMDVMRLPLGILTGMGFIGAGAILHKENMVVGVTTAATLWFTTAMGFCFGAGQLALGFSLLFLGVVVLWCLQWIESRWKQHLEAVLIVVVSSEGLSEKEIAHRLEPHGYRLSPPAVKITEQGQELRYEVHWRASQQDIFTPEPIRQLSTHPGVKALHWTPLLQR